MKKNNTTEVFHSLTYVRVCVRIRTYIHTYTYERTLLRHMCVYVRIRVPTWTATLVACLHPVCTYVCVGGVYVYMNNNNYIRCLYMFTNYSHMCTYARIFVRIRYLFPFINKKHKNIAEQKLTYTLRICSILCNKMSFKLYIYLYICYKKEKKKQQQITRKLQFYINNNNK